eukprot:scaffold663037_cov57-Prasinocladus_malaysianus.AAC.1
MSIDTKRLLAKGLVAVAVVGCVSPRRPCPGRRASSRGAWGLTPWAPPPSPWLNLMSVFRR